MQQFRVSQRSNAWLQLWLRLGVMAYFVLCMVLLWLIRFGTCAANEFVDTGIMPMHVRLAMPL